MDERYNPSNCPCRRIQYSESLGRSYFACLKDAVRDGDMPGECRFAGEDYRECSSISGGVQRDVQERLDRTRERIM